MFPRKYAFTVYFSDFGRTICGHTCTQREIYSTFARSRASQKLFSITLSTVTARILFRSQARALLTVRRLSTIPALSLSDTLAVVVPSRVSKLFRQRWYTHRLPNQIQSSLRIILGASCGYSLQRRVIPTRSASLILAAPRPGFLHLFKTSRSSLCLLYRRSLVVPLPPSLLLRFARFIPQPSRSFGILFRLLWLRWMHTPSAPVLISGCAVFWKPATPPRNFREVSDLSGEINKASRSLHAVSLAQA